ncbi:MAG: response regulator [Spirochaetaceae bacterium]
MFKLLIADDEQLERDALKYIISKSIDNIIDIDEATNGREAISKAQACKPDIVILDINMPGINGIEAGWKIREKNENIAIIFLTAFHQFDYAHEAIKINVEDYIIKPSSESRIIEVMNKVTKKLLKRNIENRHKENIEIKLNKATDYLSSEFIYNLATRNMSKDKFRDYTTILDMDFTQGRGFILKLDYESYPISIQSDYQKHILKKRCLHIINNVLIKYELCFRFNMELNNIYILIFSSNNKLEINLEEISDIIRKKIKVDINIESIIGYGSTFFNSDMALGSFTQAKSILCTVDKKNDLKSEHLPIELEINLEQSIIAINKTKTEELFEELELWLQRPGISFDAKRHACKSLVIILRHAASTQFPNGECNIDTVDINDAVTLHELITSIKIFLNEILDKISEMYQIENSPAIRRACEFIQSNFKNDISLEETAMYCNLSTFYFSKIFKVETGKNFVHYLTEVRIKKSKELLRETNLSMKEITASIGYNDPNYFTRVFKKVENISPSDYKNKKMLNKQ